MRIPASYAGRGTAARASPSIQEQYPVTKKWGAGERLVGMVRSPRATLERVIQQPRSLDLAVLVVVISASCTAGFLSTHVGQLAGLDQEVRQLESFGVVITDARYGELRSLASYRPVMS